MDIINTKKTINEISVRVCDKYPVDNKFEFDEELVVFLKGNIVKKEIKDNNDGSVDMIITFKAVDYEIKKKDDYLPRTKRDERMDEKIKGLLRTPE